MVHVFIINSHAGNKKFSAGLRNHLAKRTDINYYIVHTRQDHDESQLVKEVLNLFEGEEIRIYSCGGSGTICNIINGISDFSKVEIAFYPKGYTNDFLRVFGDKKKLFEDIDSLIDGSVMMVDYIKTNHGICLNTCSCGVDSLQVVKHREFLPLALFGTSIPYKVALMYAILFVKPCDYEVEYDGKKDVGKYIEVFFGNGGVLGGNLWMDDDMAYCDGLGKYISIRYEGRIPMFKAISHIRKKAIWRVPQLVGNVLTRSVTIRRRDGAAFIMDFDGEPQPPQVEWKMEMIKRGLPFVMPKGAI